MSTTNPVRMGIVMDTLDSIKPKKDTTLALMLEAQALGWQLIYLTMGDLHLSDGLAEGLMRTVNVFDDPDHWFELGTAQYGPLNTLDVLLMRKDPPFDIEYIMATYILERAEEEGVLVINKPHSLRDVNEKVFTAWFPQCCPPALFTRSKDAIRNFIDRYHKIVIKPSDKMGGRSVFVITKGDPNTNVIIEEMTAYGTKYVQTQLYIPEIESGGDKRILLINGVPVEHGIARMPANGDHRGNLAAGAQAKGFDLTERDRWICEQITPALKKRGLFFVGIDIIGNYLTEINVTSPTGIREIDKQFHINISSLFFNELAKLLHAKKNNAYPRC